MLQQCEASTRGQRLVAEVQHTIHHAPKLKRVRRVLRVPFAAALNWDTKRKTIILGVPKWRHVREPKFVTGALGLDPVRAVDQTLVPSILTACRVKSCA